VKQIFPQGNLNVPQRILIWISWILINIVCLCQQLTVHHKKSEKATENTQTHVVDYVLKLIADTVTIRL